MKSVFRYLFAGIRQRIQANGIRYVQQRLAQLHKLPFFHGLYYGCDAHACPGWKSVDGKFHSDAPIAMVVTRNGTVSGVVGFEIIGTTILVRQLQGAPKGDYNDRTPPGLYLTQCAEQIARALKMKTLRIVTPEVAIEYRNAAPPSDRPSPHAKEHMRKIYSFPAELKYELRYYWRLRRPTFYRSLS